MNILVTGANGFVGKALITYLLEKGHHITALVRSKKNAGKKHKHVTWIEGDLLKADSLPELKAIDSAYYLVHGLKAEAQSFEYQESLAAVNFLHWVRPTNTQIIYLGGLGTDEEALSPHLRSRHMTGSILGASNLPVVEFRASIILGEGSLSFEMIKAMSLRFPFRPDFSLLRQPCQPLALEDLLKYLEGALRLPHTPGHRIFEIGGPQVTTYGDLLDLYAELARLKRFKLKIPDVESKVIMKALDYSIPEFAEAGKKLAESLEHATVVTNEASKKEFPDIHPVDLKSAMDKARANSSSVYPPIWEKDFLKHLLSDKFLTQSGLLSPEVLRNLEKVGKLKAILSRR